MNIHKKIFEGLESIRKTTSKSQSYFAKKLGVGQNDISRLGTGGYKMKAYEVIDLYAFSLGFKVEVSLSPLTEVSVTVADAVLKQSGAVFCQFGELCGRVLYTPNGVYRFVQVKPEELGVTFNSLEDLKDAKFYV